MLKTKLSIEDANSIAAAIINRAQHPNHLVSYTDIDTPQEMMSTQKKRGRPAKMKTAEELGVDADADEYALDLNGNWADRARQSRWSDDA